MKINELMRLRAALQTATVGVFTLTNNSYRKSFCQVL